MLRNFANPAAVLPSPVLARFSRPRVSVLAGSPGDVRWITMKSNAMLHGEF